jgi:hypothetical protein
MIDREKFDEFKIEDHVEMWNRYSQDLISTYGETKEILEIVDCNNKIISNLYLIDQNLTKVINYEDTNRHR